MTKAGIVERIANENGFTKLESIDLVESVLSIIKDTLSGGEALKVSGFGSFIVKAQKDRRGRNPQTGEEITREARRVLTFKPSVVLKDAMNAASTATADLEVTEADSKTPTHRLKRGGIPRDVASINLQPNCHYCASGGAGMGAGVAIGVAGAVSAFVDL